MTKEDMIDTIKVVMSYLYKNVGDTWHGDLLSDVLEELMNNGDAELVGYGHWAHLGGDEWCCDKCGFVISTEGSWQHPKEVGHDYCMHCGIRMDGEREEDE